MNRKITTAVVLLTIFCGMSTAVLRARAVAAVFDLPTEISTGIQAGSGVSQTVKDYILKPIVRALARSMLSRLSSAIIAKIQNGGRNGGPAFVQDWSQFMTDAQYRGENVFRAELTNSHLCGDFSNDIKSIFGVKPTDYINIAGHNVRTDSLESFGLKTACTLPSNFSTTNYKKDFSANGGWDAWSRMMEPQNNPYGVLFDSLDEVAKQRTLAENGDVNEALAGNGYTSVRGACQDSSLAPGEQGPISQASGAKCTFMGKIFTPGDLLGKSAASTIDNELGWITSSTDISSIVIDVLSAVINRLGNLATANTAGDYASAPAVSDSSAQNYLACINSCPASTDTTCQMNCAKEAGYTPPSSTVTITCADPTDPTTCNIPKAPETKAVCTATGQAEQDFMLPLLNGGTSPQDVVSQTNQKFSLTTGNEAVYYPANNTIGLPEFYLAGPTASRPTSPTTGQPWDVVSRCSSGGTGGRSPPSQ